MSDSSPDAGQRWSAELYAEHGAFVPQLGTDALDLLAPQPGERILDLGCGDGTLTAEIAARGARVTGIDASPELIAAARAKGIDARLADARNLTFEAEFDAVFSNAALHWMGEPDRVLAGVHRALVPRGRFAGEFGAHGNVAAICTALLAVLGERATARPLPWYFPTPAEYADRLSANGFTIERIHAFPRPTPLRTGMRAWLETFASPFLGELAEAERGAALDRAVALLAPSLRDASGNWTADYVRLRFSATR
jgi:trans-aconitate methyltransferase